MNSRQSMSKLLNQLLDSTLDRNDKEIIFSLIVELEYQINAQREVVAEMVAGVQKIAEDVDKMVKMLEEK